MITIEAVVVRMRDAAHAGALGELSRFRQEFYRCLPARGDALFELAEAVLCADGPVTSLAELSLAPEHRRGHGGLYDAINSGRIEAGRLRAALAGVPLPRGADGRLVLAVDVSPWLRPDAPTSAERLFCHVYGRGKGSAQMIPGWPYSFVAALETGRTSWTAVLDVIRLGPADDATAVTAAQLREVVGRLIAAGSGWQETRRSSSWPMLATTSRGWRSCWPTCRWCCWDGCAATGCSGCRHHRGCPEPTAARPGTAASLPWRNRSPGRRRSTSPAPRPPVTARRGPAAGTGCIPGSPTAQSGWITMARCR